jgi:hypothetical protein
VRPPELKFEDPVLQRMFQALTSVFANISKDNMRVVELAGATHGTADTQRKFRHGLGSVPSFWFPLEGDVYVPKDGFNENEVDIRSRFASQGFKVLLVK